MMANPLQCILLLFVTSSSFISPSIAAEEQQHPCSHTSDMDIPKRVHINPKPGHDVSHRTKRSDMTFTEQFSVSVTYDSSFDTGLSLDVRQRLQNIVIPKLLGFIESVLKVRPLPGPLLFDRDCTGGLIATVGGAQYCFNSCESTTSCGTAEIPQDHLSRCSECFGSFGTCVATGEDGSGVNASFSLYISAVTTGSCPSSPDEGSTLAFAGSCELEDQFDRPVSGYVNFCPATIEDSQSNDYLLTVAKHELLHALGFSSGLYRWWRDENGDPRSPRDSNGTPTELSSNTLREVTYTDWSTANGDVSHTVSLLVTPKIVEEGRRHFNCSTLEGVQLEDQGGGGTAGSHWEARITKGEGMNGVIANDGVFSRLTYALLEDSGWYGVDYSLAEQLVWGRGTGCELAAGSCGGYIQSRNQQSESISPFCDYAQSPATLYRCDLKRTGVSNCNLVTFTSSLPAQYQYFDSSSDGGSFQTADFCPFQFPFSNTLCADTANAQDGLSNSLAETFGPQSRCVEHGEAWRAQSGNSFIQQSFTRAGCYNYTCSNGQVTIHILDQSYTCATAGEELSVSQTSNGVTYTGSIICPSCLEICYDDFDNCPEAAAVYSEFVTSFEEVSSVTSSTSSSMMNVPTTTSSSSAVVEVSTTVTSDAMIAAATSSTVNVPTSSVSSMMTAPTSSSAVADQTSLSTLVTSSASVMIAQTSSSAIADQTSLSTLFTSSSSVMIAQTSSSAIADQTSLSTLVTSSSSVVIAQTSSSAIAVQISSSVTSAVASIAATSSPPNVPTSSSAAIAADQTSLVVSTSVSSVENVPTSTSNIVDQTSLSTIETIVETTSTSSSSSSSSSTIVPTISTRATTVSSDISIAATLSTTSPVRGKSSSTLLSSTPEDNGSGSGDDDGGDDDVTRTRDVPMETEGPTVDPTDGPNDASISQVASLSTIIFFILIALIV